MISMCVVKGVPVGKARPRFSKRSGKVSVFTPNKTVDFERRLAHSWLMMHRVHCYMDAPVQVKIVASFPIPKSWSKLEKENAKKGLIARSCKPDADNIAKAVLDALNGIAFHDDKQVIRLIVEKRYDPYGDGATKIIVADLDEDITNV